MDIVFSPVSRRQAKLRMALTGVSGSGKTLGALYIAYGMTGDWSKIALIDTEHERARFYANRDDFKIGQFLYAPMYAPFSPEKYTDMVRAGAAAVGTDGVVIVDSLSHAWMAEGGVLDVKSQIERRAGQTSYTAWNDAGKMQTRLVNSILAVDCHTIVTMRSKMAYELQQNEKGKLAPVKLGLAPVQREDTEYEFDIVLDISRDHIATASKDVTFLDQYGEVLTPDLGQRLRRWMDDGDAPPVYSCEECGGVIAPSDKGSPPSVVADATKKRTGKEMCEGCFVKWATAERERLAAAAESA